MGRADFFERVLFRVSQTRNELLQFEPGADKAIVKVRILRVGLNELAQPGSLQLEY